MKIKQWKTGRRRERLVDWITHRRSENFQAGGKFVHQHLTKRALAQGVAAQEKLTKSLQKRLRNHYFMYRCKGQKMLWSNYSQREMPPTTHLPDKQVFTVQALINTVETECILCSAYCYTEGLRKILSLNKSENPKQTNLPRADPRPPGWIRSTCFQSIAIWCVNRSCGKQSMNTSKVCRERERSSTSVRLNFICDIVSTPQNHKTDFNCHHVTVLWPVSLSAVSLRVNFTI